MIRKPSQAGLCKCELAPSSGFAAPLWWKMIFIRKGSYRALLDIMGLGFHELVCSSICAGSRKFNL